MKKKAIDEIFAIKISSGLCSNQINFIRELFKFNKDIGIICRRLDDVIANASIFGLEESSNSKIVLDPFMQVESSMFNGVTVKVFITNTCGKSFCVIIGGGYDLHSFSQTNFPHFLKNSSIENVKGFGLSFALETITDIIVERLSVQKASSLSGAVFVISVGTDALKSRMQVAGELWKMGVHACFSDDETASLTDQQSHAVDKGIIWILILKDKVLHSSGTVKLRNLEKKTEIELDRSEVSKFFAPFSKRNTSISVSK